MIIFGISRSYRDGQPIRCRCEACGQPEQTTVKYFRYFHLFWLPILPLGTGQGLVCEHCQRVVVGRQLGDMTCQVRETNKDVRRPLWHFIGTIWMATVIGYNAIAADQLDALAEAAAAEPGVGDVWVVKMDEAVPEFAAPFAFGNARVTYVDEDGAELAFSDWYYGFSSSARKAAKEAVQKGDPDYFSSRVWFSADELVDLEEQAALRLVEI